MGEEKTKKVEFEEFLKHEKTVVPIPDDQLSLSKPLSIIQNSVLARVETEKRLALIKAWEESEKSKAENKAYKKFSAIEAWESSKKASVEAQLKKMEEKFEKKKAEYAEMMNNKAAEIHKAAEEDRAIIEAKRGEDFLKVEESDIRSTEKRSAATAPLKTTFVDSSIKFSMEAVQQGKPKRLAKLLWTSNLRSVETSFVDPASYGNAFELENFLAASPLMENEDNDWETVEDLFRTGDRGKVELISSSTRGFVVSFGSLIGFLPYRYLAARWKFLAFESWLRRKGLDPFTHKHNTGVKGNSGFHKILGPDIVREVDMDISPDMKAGDLLRIYDQEKLKFLSSFVGQKIKLNVLMADRRSRRLIFSMMPKEKEEMIEKKRCLMAKLSIGDVVKCCIKKITYFGIFVEVQGVPALIHLKEVSWDATLDSASYFKLGQVLDAKVHQLDFSLERIFLSLKENMVYVASMCENKYKLLAQSGNNMQESRSSEKLPPEMVAGNSPEWLPAGWNEQFQVKNGRKMKYYYKKKTGQKFYSKKDVIRYVERGNPCCGTPQQKIKDNKTSSENKPMPPEMETNETPEWLPHGWIMEMKTSNSSSVTGRKYKCYIDQLTGRKFYSKPQVFEYLKTVKSDSCASQQKKKPKLGELTRGKTSLKQEGSQNKETLEGRSCTSKQNQIGFGKQSVKEYYTDPVSGYVFRSQKDALRYLESGDINRCALKPKKRDELEFLNGETSLPSAANVHQLGQHATSRQLFEGLENCDKSSLETIDDDGLQKRQCLSVSTDAMITSTRSGKHTLDNGIEDCAETKESNHPSSSPLPRTEGSERKLGEMVCAENGTSSSLSTEMAREEKLSNNVSGNSNDRKLHIIVSKSKKKIVLSLPRRSSKRLVGIEPDLAVDLMLGERVLRDAARKSGEHEAKPSLGALNNVVLSAPQLFETLSETDSGYNTFTGPKATSNVEQSNRSMEPLENKAAPGERVGTENGTGSTSTEILREQNLAENGMGKNSSSKVQNGSSKPKKEKAVSLPRRSSKRLVGLKPEMEVNLALSEQVLRAEARKSVEAKAKPFLGTLNSAPQLLEIVLERDIAHHDLTGTEAPSSVERSEKPLEDQAVPEDQRVRQATEKKDAENLETPLLYPFDDSWSDPCLEFAFKTLTGAIPIEDNIAIQGYFQQQVDTSNPQTDGCLSLPEIGLPNFFQSDISSNFAATGKPVSVPHLPANGTFPAPGNVSLPSRSGAPQPPRLEGNNEHQTKANS
ncbi:nucleic acid-binding, OB-fold-like protein [Actinidia rufa]|uniref:Nucleic acid-binding, OB-fold-like protein n=1 Tax=Actinidia rufa TaxID=165716 RepID=A0A7J0H152_9ERIC|nr:nucleic acid-binding, OB-fold-like protein [Actinidia rufa]